jgi:hypothetical protein
VDGDCQAALPHDCRTCPLGRDGTQSQACAHWACRQGQCEVEYCPGGLQCPGGQGCPSYYLPSFDRTCSADSDCAVVEQGRCCGTTALAVRATEVDRFTREEALCASTAECVTPECYGGFATEDGQRPRENQSVAAACVNATCKAVIVGAAPPIPCGGSTCPGTQSCCISPSPTGRCVYTCMDACPSVVTTCVDGVSTGTVFGCFDSNDPVDAGAAD